MAGKAKVTRKRTPKIAQADKVFNVFASGLLDILKSTPTPPATRNLVHKRDASPKGRSTC